MRGELRPIWKMKLIDPAVANGRSSRRAMTATRCRSWIPKLHHFNVPYFLIKSHLLHLGTP